VEVGVAAEGEVGNMRRKDRNITHLILGVFGFVTLAWFINSFPPDKLVYLIVFYLTVFLSSLFLSFFILNNTRLSLLLSFTLTIFLILRYLDLHHPIYIVLLLASLISLELSLRKR